MARRWQSSLLSTLVLALALPACGGEAEDGQPGSKAARLGAELCPPGPFGSPLPEDPEISIFARQQEGVSDFLNWEGVVWVDGALYWSEIASDASARIHRQVPGGALERGFIASSGSNGLALGGAGKLLAATHDVGRISVFRLPDGARRTFRGETFRGRRFNSPNDLVLRGDGNLYFTDPDFQAGGQRPQSDNRVYRVSPTGEVSVVDDSFDQPNGVTLSADGNVLYVAGDSSLRAYPLDAAGVPAASTTFPMRLEVPDGLTVDCAGNVYAVENAAQRVRIFRPQGALIGTLGPHGFDSPGLTNVAFGGPERRTLFISGFVEGPKRGAIYSVEMNVPGLPY